MTTSDYSGRMYCNSCRDLVETNEVRKMDYIEWRCSVCDRMLESDFIDEYENRWRPWEEYK
jgi:hypothetical protein